MSYQYILEQMKKRNKQILILLLLLLSFTVNSQSDCKIYLNPVIGFDLVIGNTCDNIFDNFDSYRKNSSDEMKYLPKFITAYTAIKKITLPNGYKTEIEYNLHFKQKILVSYNLIFSIGKNHKYFFDLINFIKSYDKESINEFMYNSDEKLSFSDLDTSCKRIIRLSRWYKNNSLFIISCYVN